MSPKQIRFRTTDKAQLARFQETIIRNLEELGDYTQFKAIVEEVEKQAKAAGGRCLHVEGEPASGWVLLDYGSVVMHVFDPELRAYYDLEELWKAARLVVRIH